MAVTCKTEAGSCYPASDYAYVPDVEASSTWKLRLTKTPGGDPDPGIVGAAVAALGPGGFRGNRVEIPADDIPKVKAKVRTAWKKANPDKSADEMPETIKLSISEAQELAHKKKYYESKNETFNLRNLNKALNNINDTIDALESDPPRVESALSNARDTRSAIQEAINDYPGGKKIVPIRVVKVPPAEPPPAEMPPPAMSSEEDIETTTEEVKTLMAVANNLEDIIVRPNPDLPLEHVLAMKEVAEKLKKIAVFIIDAHFEIKGEQDPKEHPEI